MGEGRLLRDFLSRRDPHGYYVIPVRPEGRGFVERLAGRGGGRDVVIVDAVDVILVKVRSRGLASRLLRTLNRRGLLAVSELEEDY